MQTSASAAYSSASNLTGQAMMSMNQGKVAGLQTAGKDPAAIKKTAEDFEQVFLSQMFNHMFSGIKSDAMFGGGHGEEMFQSMMIDEYSKQIVSHGGVGIAKSVMHTLLSEQEKAQ
ncbi:MAG TPA: rod-binding protein [Candidatus Sulfotelmatobacter sp.]|jgi:Rod binding domain-containing protein|nr:rod-binding protein [Candidatus Sulfotelmatobacter sp.]